MRPRLVVRRRYTLTPHTSHTHTSHITHHILTPHTSHIIHSLSVQLSSSSQGARTAGKRASGAKSGTRNIRKTASKPVKPVSRPTRTSQTCPETLVVHIPRELVGHLQDERDVQDKKHKQSHVQDRTPLAKRPRTEEGRGRVSSLSEEDWEERELDDDVFKKV